MTTNLKSKIASHIYGAVITLAIIYLPKYITLNEFLKIYLIGLILNVVLQYIVVLYLKYKKHKSNLNPLRFVVFPLLSWVAWVILGLEILEDKLGIW